MMERYVCAFVCMLANSIIHIFLNLSIILFILSDGNAWVIFYSMQKVTTIKHISLDERNPDWQLHGYNL